MTIKSFLELLNNLLSLKPTLTYPKLNHSLTDLLIGKQKLFPYYLTPNNSHKY